METTHKSPEAENAAVGSSVLYGELKCNENNLLAVEAKRKADFSNGKASCWGIWVSVVLSFSYWPSGKLCRNGCVGVEAG